MIERILSNLFPPRLSSLNPVDDLKDTLEYRARLLRKGIEANPSYVYGGQVVAIYKGQSAFKKNEEQYEI